jgi:hypothetical protein
MFSEGGGFSSYGAYGGIGTAGVGAQRDSYARSGPLGFETETFGHASGLANDRLNDDDGKLGAVGGLTRSGDGIEHRHSRIVSSFGSGTAGRGAADIGNGGNGPQSEASFVQSSNFENYVQIRGSGNSGFVSGSMEQSKGSGPRTGSNSGVADVYGSAGSSRHDLESPVYPSSIVDRGTRTGTGMNGARNSLGLKSGSLVRTRSGGLLGTEPRKESIGVGGGAGSNVSSLFIVSEIRGSNSGRSTDYGGDGKLPKFGTSGAASGTEELRKQLQALERVSASHSGSFSGRESNIGAHDFESLVGQKPGTGLSGTASDAFGPAADTLGHLHVTRTEFGVGSVGGGVAGSVAGDGKGRLRLLEREMLSSRHSVPVPTMSQSSSRSLKGSEDGLGSTNRMGTSDLDDGNRGLGEKGTFGRNKGFVRSSSTYTFKREEMKRSFGSGHTGLTPGGSLISFEPSDNSGLVSATSGPENTSPRSQGKGLVSGGGGGAISVSSRSSNSGGGVGSSGISSSGRSSMSTSSSSSSSTGTVADSGHESTSGAQNNSLKSYSILSTSASRAETRSAIDLEDSGESVGHFGSRSASNKTPNGTSISSRSAGPRGVGGNSGSGTDLEGDFSGNEGNVDRRTGISSRNTKSVSGNDMLGGSSGNLEGAYGSGDISASVRRSTYNFGGDVDGSESATESGVRGHARSFRKVYEVRGSSSLQTGFDGERSSNVGSHYGTDSSTDGSNLRSEGSATSSFAGIGGSSGPEGSAGIEGGSVLIGSVSRLRDGSSDFRSAEAHNNSSSGSSSGTLGRSVAKLGGSILSGTENVHTGDSYTGSSGKTGRRYGSFDGGRYRGDILGTDGSSHSNESDGDVSEGPAIALGGFRNNYEASGASGMNDHEELFVSGGEKSHSRMFGSSTGNLRSNYGLAGSSGGGESGSVVILGDSRNFEKGSSNSGFGDTPSSPFENNYPNNGLSEINRSQKIVRTSYIASTTHSDAIGGSTGSVSDLLRDSELESGGVVIENDTQSNFGSGHDIHRRPSTGNFVGSIGGISNLANHGSGGTRGSRSDVTHSQIQRELASDNSATSVESFIRGSGCVSGTDGYGRAGEGCVEGNGGSDGKHQWNAANFGEEQSTGESGPLQNFGESENTEVHIRGNLGLIGGFEGSKNPSRKSRLMIGTGRSGIVNENWKSESIVGSVYGTSKLKSGSSSSGLTGIPDSGFSGFRGTDTESSSASDIATRGGSTSGGELSSPTSGNALDGELISNVNNFQSLADYMRYISGLRALGEGAALRGKGEFEHRTGMSVNAGGYRGSSSHGGLSNGRADETNAFSVGGRSVAHRVTSSGGYGESSIAGGEESGEPGGFGTNAGSKDGYVVASFWSSGGIPDCGSGPDGTDIGGNSGTEPQNLKHLLYYVRKLW